VFEDVSNPGDPVGAVYQGYVFKHPDFGAWKDFPGSYSHENNHDMAVIILDEVPDIEPVSLAGIGALDALKGTKGQKKPLTAVGYGTTDRRGGPDPKDPWTWDFARRSAAWELSGLKKSYAHTTSPDQQGPCDGDHGGPILTDNPEAVAALIVNWDGICGAKGVGLGYRIDTTEAYEFLCNVGSQVNGKDWIDVQGVEDPNYPYYDTEGNLVPDPTPESNLLDFPSIAPSALALAGYCDDGGSDVKAASASADDGGAQIADRQQNSKSKHNKGGKHRGKGKRGR
jgi:hypothetical protein